MNLLECFASTLLPPDTAGLVVRDYFQWQTQNLVSDFIPSADDDIDLRTYLLDLKSHGADLAVLEERTAALKRFYQWLRTEGVIEHNPFDEYNFLHPFLTCEMIDIRQQTLPKDDVTFLVLTKD